MSLLVRNNMASVQILNILAKNNRAMMRSMQHIATGQKINSAADDPSAYAISERMRIQISALYQASDNAKKGQDMLKTAEDAVGSTVEILKTLKQKVLDATNDTNTDADRKIIQQYLDQAVGQINDNANTTYNGKLLVDGSHNGATEAAASRFTNSSLSAKTTFDSALTDLRDRRGNKPDITKNDKITISFVANGKTVTTSFKIVGSTAVANKDKGEVKTLKDVFERINETAGKSSQSADLNGAKFDSGTVSSVIGKAANGSILYSSDGKSVLSIGAAEPGTDKAISGFNISVSDTNGNIKKSVDSYLDNWDQTVKPQDRSSADNSLSFQVGTEPNQAIKVGLGDMRAHALGLQGINKDGTVQNLDITSRDKANAAISVVDNALNTALGEQTKIGAAESRLDNTQDNLNTQAENLEASDSTIRDANIAKEMTEYVKYKILTQAAMAMLAQSNQNSMDILQLLK